MVTSGAQRSKNALWACPVLAGVHDQGPRPGEDAGHGDHGRQAAWWGRWFTRECKAEMVGLCQGGDRWMGRVAGDSTDETAVTSVARQAERDARARGDRG